MSQSPIYPCSYNVFASVSTITVGTTLYLDNCLTDTANSGWYSDGTNCYEVGVSGTVLTITSCAATTTTTLTYDHYLADTYDCSNSCSLDATSVLVAFPSGTSVTIGYFYVPLTYDGFVYEITSTSLSTGGIVMSNFGFSTCNTACNVV